MPEILDNCMAKASGDHEQHNDILSLKLYFM